MAGSTTTSITIIINTTTIIADALCGTAVDYSQQPPAYSKTIGISSEKFENVFTASSWRIQTMNHGSSVY